MRVHISAFKEPVNGLDATRALQPGRAPGHRFVASVETEGIRGVRQTSLDAVNAEELVAKIKILVRPELGPGDRCSECQFTFGRRLKTEGKKADLVVEGSMPDPSEVSAIVLSVCSAAAQTPE
jgi:hypothetical protein